MASGGRCSSSGPGRRCWRASSSPRRTPTRATRWCPSGSPPWSWASTPSSTRRPGKPAGPPWTTGTATATSTRSSSSSRTWSSCSSLTTIWRSRSPRGLGPGQLEPSLGPGAPVEQLVELVVGLRVLQLGQRLLELPLGLAGVDVGLGDGPVDEDRHLVVADLEEPPADGETGDLAAGRADAEKAAAEGGDEGGVAGEDPQLPDGQLLLLLGAVERAAAPDQIPRRRRHELGFTVEDRPRRADDGDLQGARTGSLGHRLDLRPGRLGGGHDLVDGALHIEGLLRQVVVLAGDDGLERLDRVGQLHVPAGDAGELLRYEE